jgi:hypothetical protein
VYTADNHGSTWVRPTWLKHRLPPTHLHSSTGITSCDVGHLRQRQTPAERTNAGYSATARKQYRLMLNR